MEPYVWRLQHIGFSKDRAYDICSKYRSENNLEGLDQLISELEDEWEIEQCG